LRSARRSRAAAAVLAAAIVLVAGCRGRSGQGNVVTFDFKSKDGGPVLIASRNVRAQRDGDALIVTFEKVVVGRAQRESRDLLLDNLSVRVFGPGRDAIAKSPDKSLGRVKLTGNQPIAELPAMQFRVGNAGPHCQTGCLVTASVEVAGRPTAETEPVEIQLAAGKAVATEPGTEPDPRDSRCPFTAAKATVALGQPMKYETVDENECALVPAGGATPFTLTVVQGDTKTFNALTKLDNAEMMTIADRAVWVPGGAKAKSVLCAQKDNWTVTVTVPGGKTETRSQAEAIVSKITEKL
jgi:hypothetical protein